VDSDTSLSPRAPLKIASISLDFKVTFSKTDQVGMISPMRRRYRKCFDMQLYHAVARSKVVAKNLHPSP